MALEQGGRLLKINSISCIGEICRSSEEQLRLPSIFLPRQTLQKRGDLEEEEEEEEGEEVGRREARAKVEADLGEIFVVAPVEVNLIRSPFRSL